MTFPAGALAAILPTIAGIPQLHAEQTPASAPSAPEVYRPKLIDIMLTVQTRHARLSLAGEARNWPLAEFQVEELKEAFEDAEKYHATFKDVPVKKMIEAIANPAIADVEKAVAAKDHADFVWAFRKLTVACNRCHEAANRPFIVIQRHATSSFPNQSFAPHRN
jgi:hypothetical protein